MLARDTVNALDRAAGAELERLGVFADSTVILPLDPLRSLPRQTAAEVLRQGAGRLGSRAPLRAWAHRGLRRVLATPALRRPFRLGGVTIEVSCGLVRLALAATAPLPARAVAVPGRTELPEIGLALQAHLLAADEYTIPRESNRAAFDADGLAGPLVVRARRCRSAAASGESRRCSSTRRCRAGIEAASPWWSPVARSSGSATSAVAPSPR